MSLAARISSKSPCEVVSTPTISGRMPVRLMTPAARWGSSSANAAPTVPWPSSPMRKVSGISEGEVLVGLAAHYHPRLAIPAKDHRRARDAVVVVGHRVAVGAGDGGDEDVARLRVAQRRRLDEHVTGLAVLADDRVRPAVADAIRDLRLVAGAVEHRPQVVGHAAVD